MYVEKKTLKLHVSNNLPTFWIIFSRLITFACIADQLATLTSNTHVICVRDVCVNNRYGIAYIHARHVWVCLHSDRACWRRVFALSPSVCAIRTTPKTPHRSALQIISSLYQCMSPYDTQSNILRHNELHMCAETETYYHYFRISEFSHPPATAQYTTPCVSVCSKDHKQSYHEETRDKNLVLPTRMLHTLVRDPHKSHSVLASCTTTQILRPPTV